MIDFQGVSNDFGNWAPLVRLVIAVVVSFVVLSIILNLLRKGLLSRAKTKKQRTNVLVFIRLIKYVFALIALLIVVFSYFGSWTELGLVAGLLSVAAGLALSKPISSVVAWLIIVTRRPFEIGDRIAIGELKGDVKDITLTHLYLDEIGGTTESEESSGRVIIVPNSILFESKIINYTTQNNYILDEVVTTITYESKLEEAEKLIEEAVEEVMKEEWKNLPSNLPRKPIIRLRFRESGIDVIVRYYTPVSRRNENSTNVTREILRKIRRSKDVEIAYPHTEVLLRRS